MIASATTTRTTASGWREAVTAWSVGCLVLGVGGFVVCGRWLRASPDRFWAGVYWQLAFAAGLAITQTYIVWRLKQRGESLRHIGWRAPTSRKAIAAGVLLGVWYSSGVIAGILHDDLMAGINPFAFHWVRLALIPVGIAMAIGEESLMRGFIMRELSVARVLTWLSGACSAVYHAIHNWSWLGFLPSFVLFTLHAGLFVAARRSLTPTSIAHSLDHDLNAPYLLMYALQQVPA